MRPASSRPSRARRARPGLKPRGKRIGGLELRRRRRRVRPRKCAEGVGEIRLALRHPLQQVEGQRGVTLFLRRKAQLGAQDPVPRIVEPPGKPVHGLGEFLDRPVTVRHQRQKRRGQLREVPDRDLRLVSEGVAPVMVDGGEHHLRVIGIEEGAGPIVDRLARDRHVVGVHHAMDEAHAHPLRHQLGLRGDDRIEQVQRPSASG
jgi:hypothetical protein